MLSIGIGSITSTGGVVIEGNTGLEFDGLVVSSVGHKATSPACKLGIGKIVAVGGRTTFLPAGPAARAGDYVACGCPAGSNILLAQGTVTVGAQSGNGVGRINSSLAEFTERPLSMRSVSAEESFAEGPHTNVREMEAGDVALSSAGSTEALGRRDTPLSYQLESPEFNLRQAAFLPAEGVGVNGTFFIKGALSLNGRELFVSAMGFTAANHMGAVHFQAGRSQRPSATHEIECCHENLHAFNH